MRYVTTSVEETRALAAELLDALIAARVVLLSGTLGAGKTAFTQGIGEALGVTRHVKSPTYTLVQVYEVEHPQITQLVHADLYRLEQIDRRSFDDIGLQAYLDDPKTLTVIEWPERLAFPLPGAQLTFHVEGGRHHIEWKQKTDQ